MALTALVGNLESSKGGTRDFMAARPPLRDLNEFLRKVDLLCEKQGSNFETKLGLLPNAVM